MTWTGPSRHCATCSPSIPLVLDDLAARVLHAGCTTVLCDIAPLGIAVAERAGLPSVLIESFSWQWLYEPLYERVPDLERFGAELDQWWNKATVHIQTEPLCWRDAAVETLVDPISRAPRLERGEIRTQLDIPLDARVVVITMGALCRGHALSEAASCDVRRGLRGDRGE